MATRAVTAEAVQAMLGLADRARIIDLFEALMRGDIAEALADFRDLYDTGADPAVVIADLADFTHLVTRFKIVPAAADDRALTQAERERGRALAEKLSVRALTRTWQMLFKGYDEVASAGKPAQAAEMVLVRLAYAADLPTPDEALRSTQDSQRRCGGPHAYGAGADPRPDPGPRMAMTAEGGGRPQPAPAACAGTRVAAPRPTRRGFRSLADVVGARRRQARSRHQARGREFPAAGADRGGPPRGRASSRARPAISRRSRLQAFRMDRTPLARRRLRSRERRNTRRRWRPRSRTQLKRDVRQILWSRRC